MLNILKNLLRSGYSLFYQEKITTIVSLGTTLIVSFFIWLGFFSFYFFKQTISFLEERLDFSIYFKPETTSEEITNLQKVLKNFPGVMNVNLITQEEALEKFKKETKTSPIIQKALGELNINPLVDYLVVKAKSAEAYPKIIDYLEKSPYKSYIDYVTYFENQKIIQKIISLSNKIRFLVSIIIILILALSLLIIFNNILMTVYSQKENIEVLRLVGASNWFIRGPFFVYSFLFTFTGYLISLIIIMITFLKTETFWSSLLSNLQPISFITNNFLILNSIAFLLILFINWLATFLALEKYLKI